jgi:hypothetical protein
MHSNAAAAYKIQKWARFQKHRLLCKHARNSQDPITLDNVTDIPLHQLFTYIDNDGKIWAYDGPAWAQWILKHRMHPLSKTVLNAHTMKQCFEAASRSMLHLPTDKELKECLKEWMRPVRLVYMQKNVPCKSRLLQRKYRKRRAHWSLILYVSPLYRFLGADVDVKRSLVVKFDVEEIQKSPSSAVDKSYQDRMLDGGKGFVALGSNAASVRVMRRTLEALSDGTLTEAELAGLDDDDDEDWLS